MNTTTIPISSGRFPPTARGCSWNRVAARALNSSRNPKIAFSPLNLSVTLKFIRSPEGNISGFNRVAEDGTRHARKISGQPLAFHKLAYTRQDAMIPMRDGVKLHAAILRPKGSTAPLPFLMVRTPYGVDGNTPESINSLQPELAASGYIFVFEDIRGRYKSEGTFAMMRPMAEHHDAKLGDPKLVDESTDAYDTVAWLAEKCSQQQRPGGSIRRLLSGISGHGCGHRSASRGKEPSLHRRP